MSRSDDTASLKFGSAGEPSSLTIGDEPIDPRDVPEVVGVTYNPHNRLFYTAYIGTVYNSQNTVRSSYWFIISCYNLHMHIRCCL